MNEQCTAVNNHALVSTLSYYSICTTLAPQIYADVCPRTIKVVHNTCKMCTNILPDMCTLGPAALRMRVHVPGKALVPMFQLLHVLMPQLTNRSQLHDFVCL